MQIQIAKYELISFSHILLVYYKMRI